VFFYSSNTHFKENKIVENFLLTMIKNPIKKSMKILDEITRDSTEIGETYFDVFNTHY